MTNRNLRVNAGRLLERIDALARIGAIEGGGVCRLALTEEDRQARDLVIQWMHDLGLEVSVDRIGNVVGTRAGREGGLPIMTGSHIDTVRTGGRYDGNLGVLAGLEVVETLNECALSTRRPLAVAFFTNEEGARFAPDMMGSMVHQGHLRLQDMLSVEGIDGTTVGEALRGIGYEGEEDCGQSRAHAFVELHVEQGPVLEREGITIGAVQGVQGISWTEVTFGGVSNHAGTTPMALRTDAGYAAFALATYVRGLAEEMGGTQVATVGSLNLRPNLVNVIPNAATMTVDLRNTDDARLCQAEQAVYEKIEDLSRTEGVEASRRSLARFQPERFDQDVVAIVEREARALDLSVRRMPSGAGHDAQSFAPNCPTGMIFVPSAGGISHNVSEHTTSEDVAAGANVLLQVLLRLADD